MARYIDTGGRDASKTVASWLAGQTASDIVSFRFQTGYFGANGLGPMLNILTHLRASHLPIAAVIGANNGETTKADLSQILVEMGIPRVGARLAITSFDGGLFHPKVIQFERLDGTKAAYVGSANITQQGMSGGNIEAGIILDTSEGDQVAVLDEIAVCIEDWFIAGKQGSHIVANITDVDNLVASGILSIVPPPRPPSTSPSGSGVLSKRPRLKPLISLPKLTPISATAGLVTGPVVVVATPLPPIKSPAVGFGVDPILVAEIGGGNRWKQANFPIALIQNYFGISMGVSDSISLSHVDPTGTIAPPEVIPFVAVKSQNYRFELKSVSGIPYPTIGRPIGVFLRTSPKSFNYRVFMPSDTGHSQLDSFLLTHYIGPGSQLKRAVTTVADLSAAWPLCPVI